MKTQLLYGDISEKILRAAFDVHNALGEGLSEKVYERATAKRIRTFGLGVEQQKSLPVFFEDQKVGEQVIDLLEARLHQSE